MLKSVRISLFGLIFVVAAGGQTAHGQTPPTNEEIQDRAEAMAIELQLLTNLFEARAFDVGGGKTMPYRLFTPAGYDPAQEYPLVMYLHGSGGRGTENHAQYWGGNLWGARVWALPVNQVQYPSFVVAPQASEALSGGPFAWTETSIAIAMSLLDSLITEFSIATDQIYVTGQSMGGMGTWLAISTYPERFAAGLPVCGSGDTMKASLIVQNEVAVWAFHGAKDNTVPVAGSRDFIAALEAAGGMPRYTEYPDMGHDSWMGAYTEPDLINWVFAQKRDDGGSKAR